MAKQPSLPQQDFDYKNTTNVSRAMIKAGSSGKSRIKAGMRAAWNAKVSSMYGEDTTKGAIGLRLLGLGETAKWYDRFFAKETAKERKRSGGADDSGSSGSGGNNRTNRIVATGVKQIKGELRGINNKLDILYAVGTDTQKGISDIKSLLMPKGVVAKNASGQTKFVQFNPLAPQGEQFNVVTEGGKLTPMKPGKDFQASAQKKAALATAQLALKILEEDKKKQTYKWKDKKEEFRKKDPIGVLTEKVEDLSDKIDGIGKKDDKGIFGWLSGLLGGFWSKLVDFFTKPLAILGSLAALLPLAGMLAKGSLVGLAGLLGYKLGTWLNEEFQLAERINDAIQKAAGWFGKGNEAKIRASDRAAVDSKNAEIAEINRQLAGTGYTKQAMSISKDGTTYSGGGYLDAQGNKVYEQDLPVNVRRQLGKSVDPIEREPTMFSSGGPTSRRRGRAPEKPKPTATPSESTGSLMLAETPSSSTSSVPYGFVNSSLGMTKDEWDVYRSTIASIESGGKYDIAGGANNHYDGRYQLGSMAKKDASQMLGMKYPGHDDEARAAFRADPSLQENMFAAFTAANHKYLSAKSKKYQSLPLRQKLEVLGYAHNQGWGGAKNWLETGSVGADAFGTKGTKYSQALAQNYKALSPQTMAGGPVPSSSGVAIDSGNRGLAALNSSSAGSPVVTTTVVNNQTNNNVGKRPMAKADVVTRDEALVRSASRDSRYPAHS